MDPLYYVLVIVACLAFSAFFSGSETALMRLRSHDLERDVRAARNPAAVAVNNLLDSTSRLLVTILLGNNVVNIFGAALASALAIHYLPEGTAVIVATVVMTLLVLILSEILPKAVAARSPRRFSYAVALPLYLIHWVLRPVHALFDRCVEPAVRWIAGGADGEIPGSTEELLRLARSAREKAPSGTPASIIGGVARAHEMTVSDIMIPRTEILAFPADIAPATLLEKVLEERYTRVPIYADTIDRFVGLVHMKDLVKLLRAGGTDLQSILKPILRVPERKPVLGLLADMQRAFVHMAVVKDEFGVTEGLVTQEDILEELVGEIRDEFDREELLTIRRQPDGSFDVLGRIRVLDFNRETGWNVPAERGDTLGGLVFNTLGRAARKGDVVRVPGYQFTVLDVSGGRIVLVRVIRTAEEGPEEASES